jgi:ribosomal protein S7
MKITPSIDFFKVKLGGAPFSIPMPINERRRILYSVKWVIKLLIDKYKFLNLSIIIDTMVSALYNKGLSIQKKNSVYKIGKQNRHLLRFLK